MRRSFHSDDGYTKIMEACHFSGVDQSINGRVWRYQNYFNLIFWHENKTISGGARKFF